ncbi:keratinocyte-associated protein 2 [Striga asiatica]|uniref:Keratinocyte-associated protein 2 n=1 Tax=Striga asiatica TaxID=4170 RepID=A0A5A7Q0S1_STRAF|nr:keratinocyte-associated protein 2 [Striga asiatica]
MNWLLAGIRFTLSGEIDTKDLCSKTRLACVNEASRCGRCRCGDISYEPNDIRVEFHKRTTFLLKSCALHCHIGNMAAAGSSMLYSFLLFMATLSLQEMFRTKLASSELFTILGGFTSSIIFLMLLTFIGNYQETIGVKTGWGSVIIAEIVALIAASTVHRVCITTCFLFSAGLLYEVNKLSGV